MSAPLRWALKTYFEMPDAWQKMQKRAMQSDFGWRESAARYAALYQKYGGGMQVSESKGTHPWQVAKGGGWGR